MRRPNKSSIQIVLIVCILLGLLVCCVISYWATVYYPKKLEEHSSSKENWTEQPSSALGYSKNLFNLSPADFEVYLINLDRNPDRLNRFSKYYKRTDLGVVKDFKRIPAIDGRKIDARKSVSNQAWKEIQDAEWYGYRTKHNQLTLGAVGCYLSHMKIYQQLRDSQNLTYGIIFEDDVKFVRQDVLRQIRHFMTLLPDDWDMLLLGCVCHVCKKNETYQDLKHFFLMHAYVVRQTSAAKILGYIEHMPIRQQIDSELSSLASTNKLKIVCLNRPLVVQDGTQNKTTIQSPLRFIEGINPFEIPLN